IQLFILCLLTLIISRSLYSGAQPSVILLIKLRFLVLNIFLMLIRFLKPCIPSMAALLSEYILTFDSEGAASKAVHIAPSSARVEEGQSAILLLKLILFLLLSLLATIHPIPIFFPSLFPSCSATNDPSV